MLVFMRTQYLRPSSQQSEASAHHGHSSIDWKRLIRLNVLDLNSLLQNTTPEAQPWVCGEPQLMRLLQVVSDEVASLNALLRAAGEPALPCGPADLLHLLGVASIRKPDTWQSRLHFCLRFLIGLARLVNLTNLARLELSSTTPAVR
jgi:hypothetical protein